MIEFLQLQSFKCFDDLKLQLGRLTLLTGFNGGGKSTAIQPLLLLAQNMRLTSDPKQFSLNGPLVRLGTVGDVLPSDVETSGVTFALGAHGAELKWHLSSRAGDKYFGLKSRETLSVDLSRNEVAKIERDVNRTLADLVYVSAVRGGAADAFPSLDAGHEAFSTVGVDGRFAPFWYDRFVDNEIPEERRHPGEEASTFRKQLDAWLGVLFPGAQANVQTLPSVSLLSLQFRLSGTGSWKRPANIGYGLTYAFPILVSLLAARDGQAIVIDSPEAHLHPFAQSQMGLVLSYFAAAGVQIIVETHSDHLLNGARLAVKDGLLKSSMLSVHFFTGKSAHGHGVISPSISPEGQIYEWPEGFFDQSEKDLLRLTELD